MRRASAAVSFSPSPTISTLPPRSRQRRHGRALSGGKRIVRANRRSRAVRRKSATGAFGVARHQHDLLPLRPSAPTTVRPCRGAVRIDKGEGHGWCHRPGAARLPSCPGPRPRPSRAGPAACPPAAGLDPVARHFAQIPPPRQARSRARAAFSLSARASGCDGARSQRHRDRKILRRHENPSSVGSGAPMVNVPVLSKTTTSTSARRSSAVPLLISRPLRNSRARRRRGHRRHGQAQGAGTGDDQDRHRDVQRQPQIAAQATSSRERRGPKGYAPPAHRAPPPCRRARCSSPAHFGHRHQAGHAVQRGIGPAAVTPQCQHTGQVDLARADAVPGPAKAGRLSPVISDRSISESPSDHAVDGHAPARPHQHESPGRRSATGTSRHGPLRAAKAAALRARSVPRPPTGRSARVR
jgi:hypothetical protein